MVVNNFNTERQARKGTGNYKLKHNSLVSTVFVIVRRGVVELSKKKKPHVHVDKWCSKKNKNKKPSNPIISSAKRVPGDIIL